LTVSGLATVETILSYCINDDSANAPKYRLVIGSFTSGHSVSEIENDQKSSSYSSAVGALNAQLAKLPASTVVSACRNYLAGK
jgi:hypothetical protein